MQGHAVPMAMRRSEPVASARSYPIPLGPGDPGRHHFGHIAYPTPLAPGDPGRHHFKVPAPPAEIFGRPHP